MQNCVWHFSLFFICQTTSKNVKLALKCQTWQLRCGIVVRISNNPVTVRQRVITNSMLTALLNANNNINL